MQPPVAAPEPPSMYMSVDEVAEFLRCRKQRVYDMLSRRRLPQYRDGGRVLLKRSDVERHVEATMVDARSPRAR